MTQATRPQIPWLADLPADDITGYIRASMTAVCRGHEEMGLLLSYFFAGASWKAKNEGIDIETSPCIDLEHTHEDILKKVHISRKSLNNYLKRLAEWGYLEAPKYQRIYHVYCKKIVEAIKTPPEPIAAKPRGKYAPAKAKPTQEEKDAKKRLDLQQKVVNLQHKVVSLQTKVVSLQQELVNLQPFETGEAAREQGLEGIFEAPRIYRITKDLKEDSHVVSASAASDGVDTFLSQFASFEETLQEVQNGQAPLTVSPGLTEGHKQEEPMKPPADTSKESAHASTPNDITSQEEALQEESPTQVALLPAVPGTPTKPPPPSKTDGKGKSKIPEAVPLCSSRLIREAIDALRGYSLEETGAIIHQNKVLKEWCQKHTLEDYQRVIDHVTKGYCTNEKHQWWRQRERVKAFFNADKLAELTPGILAELGHIPKPVAPPEVAPKEEKIIGWQPQRRITPPKGVTVIYAQR